MALSEIEKLERRYAENPQGLTFAPLAEVHRKNGDVARALELLRPGLTLHPDYIPASIVLGRCHFDLGELPAAETAFTHVLSLDGENVIALKALADIAERQSRFDEAERRLRTLLAIDRSNDEARAHLDRVEAARRQAEAASPASSASSSGASAAHADATAQEDTSSAAGDPDAASAQTSAASADMEAAADTPGEPAPALGLPPLPEPPHEAVLAWVEEPASDVAVGPPLELEELDLSDAGSAAPPEGIEVEQPVTLEEPVEPLPGLVGREDKPSSADLHGAGDPWQVETAEDIVLESSGYSEFQMADASEELRTTERPVDQDPLMPTKAAIEAQGEEPPATVRSDDASIAEESVRDGASIERWPAALATSRQAAAEPPPAESGAGDMPVQEYEAAHAGGPPAESAGAREDGARVGEGSTPAVASAASATEPSAMRTEPLATQPEAAEETARLAAAEAPSPPAGTPSPTEPSAAGRAEPWSAPLAEPPAAPEPDLVVTESMAELLLQQGHAAEALVVYRHLERRTSNRRFQDRIAELERSSRAEEASPRRELETAPAGREAAAPAFVPAPPSYSVRQTGGQSVRDFLGSVLAARLPTASPAAPRVSEAAAGASGAAPEGAPTRPAHDSLSLSSVFGEESTPTPPAVPAGNAASQQGGVSYDEFFGSSGSGSSHPRAPDPKSDDLDQFHAWLQNLKR